MASNPKYQYVDMDNLRETQKEALEDFADRVSDFAQGTAKEYAAPFANTAGMLLDVRAKAIKDSPLPPGGFNGAGYTGMDWKTINNTESILLHGAAEKAQGAADKWKQSGAENLKQAKQGLTPIGKGGIDASSQFAKMVGDKALGAATKIGATPYLALRTFGDAAQTARQEGASVGQQTLYGAESAISSAVIEKWFDGLSGLYGKGATKAWAEKFASLFKNNKDLQKYAEATFNDVGEGMVESVLTDVADQLLKTTYNGKSIAENYQETELDRVKRDMIINTIASILFGDKAFRK